MRTAQTSRSELETPADRQWWSAFLLSPSPQAHWESAASLSFRVAPHTPCCAPEGCPASGGLQQRGSALATRIPLAEALLVGAAGFDRLRLLLHVCTGALAAWCSWRKSQMPGTEDSAGLACAQVCRNSSRSLWCRVCVCVCRRVSTVVVWGVLFRGREQSWLTSDSGLCLLEFLCHLSGIRQWLFPSHSSLK